MIALLVMTDGRRDCIAATISSARVNLGPSVLISERWIHNDSPDPAFAEWLRASFPDFRIVTAVGRSGFDGAIRSAWLHLRTFSTARYIFHLEDDFTFNRPVNLAEMAAVLDYEPNLLQLALRRQPWNAEERAAGGIVELHPDDFERRTTKIDVLHVARWLAHRRFFTTNPSLYRRTLIETTRWPAGADSEGRYGIERFADPDVVAGFFGDRSSGEWVHHIGHERVGTGY
jgi:hypothetical protein